MVRNEELAMTLLAEANPVPDEEELEFEPIATKYLESLRARRNLMTGTKDPVDTSGDRTRRYVVVGLVAAAVVAGVIALGFLIDNDPTPGPVDQPEPAPTTTTDSAPTTVPAEEEEQPQDVSGFPANLTGIYAGTAIYEEENGAPHDRLTYQLELEDDDETITGFLSHANALTSDFSLGRGRMPVVVERTGDTISVRWDESVGARDDTTEMQCDVVEIWFTASVLEDPEGLQIEDGRWDASGDEPSEFDEECHNHGFPITLRGILRVRTEPVSGSP